MKKRIRFIICVLLLMSVVLSSVARAETTTTLSDSDSEWPSNNTITYCRVKFNCKVKVSHGLIFTNASVKGTSEAWYEGVGISFSHSVKLKASGVAISIDSSGPSASTTSDSVTISSGTLVVGKSHKITISNVSFSALIFTTLRVTTTGSFNGINKKNGGISMIHCEATDSMTVW